MQLVWPLIGLLVLFECKRGEGAEWTLQQFPKENGGTSRRQSGVFCNRPKNSTNTNQPQQPNSNETRIINYPLVDPSKSSAEDSVINSNSNKEVKPHRKPGVLNFKNKHNRVSNSKGSSHEHDEKRGDVINRELQASTNAPTSFRFGSNLDANLLNRSVPAPFTYPYSQQGSGSNFQNQENANYRQASTVYSTDGANEATFNYPMSRNSQPAPSTNVRNQIGNLNQRATASTTASLSGQPVFGFYPEWTLASHRVVSEVDSLPLRSGQAPSNYEMRPNYDQASRLNSSSTNSNQILASNRPMNESTTPSVVDQPILRRSSNSSLANTDPNLCIDCPICLEEYTEPFPRNGSKIPSDVSATNCHHYYHTECLRKWVQTGRNPENCPLCRSNLGSLYHELIS